MKSSSKLVEADQKMNSAGEIPLDPFAVDFFGGSNNSVGEISPVVEKRGIKKQIRPLKKSDWYKNLPRLSNQEAEFSYSLQSLPENLAEKSIEIITESIARYTFREAQNIKLSMISVSETNLNEAITKIANSSQVFLTLRSQPDNSLAVIVLNTTFASSVIDMILGGQGANLSNPRNLSPIENSIIEFIALNILGDINNYLSEPFLSLQNITTKLDAPFALNERGAEIVVNFELDNFSGIISFIVPQSFLQSLDKTQNPLLVKKSKRNSLSSFEKLVQKLDLRLQIGTTLLDGDSLLFLEPDDIVLIEQPEITLQNGKFTNKLQICIGHGKTFRLQGIVDESSGNNEISFQIGEILSEGVRRKFTPAKFKMDEKENELTEETTVETEEQIADEPAQDEEISPSLENVQVALRVEIAGNKLSLRELQSLRIGQVIALGCRPTDPVRLVTDNNEEPIATGELIEIEGQLGVRLTKVFI